MEIKVFSATSLFDWSLLSLILSKIRGNIFEIYGLIASASTLEISLITSSRAEIKGVVIFFFLSSVILLNRQERIECA